LTDIGGDEVIVSRDDLQCHAEIFKTADGLDDIRFRRIKQHQESQKCHAGFVDFTHP
jgi:hypothetical protein